MPQVRPSENPPRCEDKKARRPENYLPADEDLLAIVRRRPLISVRELCAELWPVLPWLPETPDGDSITRNLWIFPAGQGTVRKTAAQWLLEQMQRLVIQGHVRFAPYRGDQATSGHREGGLSYVIPV